MQVGDTHRVGWLQAFIAAVKETERYRRLYRKQIRLLACDIAFERSEEPSNAYRVRRTLLNDGGKR
jgi:hypothetical protein